MLMFAPEIFFRRKPFDKGTIMQAPLIYDLRANALDVTPGVGAEYIQAVCDVLAANKTGFTKTVSTTGNMTGVRTSASVFTRTDGGFVDKVTITHAVLPVAFTINETVTETGSNAQGVVLEATKDRTVIRPTVDEQFTGTAVLTGSTSGITATGTGKTAVLKNMAGWWVYSYDPANVNTGVFAQVVSNTATAVTIDGTLQTVGTRLIVYPRREDALKAVDIVLTTV